MGFSLRRVAWFLGITIPISGCFPTRVTGNGNLKIDSGTSITAQSKNRAPAVHWLGNCTGTAVSHNTLLYAGHCTGGGIPQGTTGLIQGKVCINKNLANPDNPSVGACSTSLFVHPGYASEDFRFDVAIGVFPDNTFKNYFPVQTQMPARGDKVILVGYSSQNLPDSSNGSKRWGFNTFSRADSDQALISEYGGSAARVAVSPGDSGGPLFYDCKVVGVASRMATSGSKISLHTNMTLSDTQSWMRELVKSGGANICGLPGTDQAHCQAAALGGWDKDLRDKNQTQDFPCAPSSQSGQQDGLPANPISVLLSAASSGGLDISVGTTRLEGVSAAICAGKGRCAGPETQLSLTQRNAQSLVFGPARWSAVPGQEMTVLIRDASGSVIASRSLRLNRRS